MTQARPVRITAPWRRERLVVTSLYASAVILVFAVFFCYRVRVHHATFATRGFFWMGDIHGDAGMGFRMRSHRQGFAVLNYGLHDKARQIAVRTDAWGHRIPNGRDPNLLPPGGIAAIGCSCTFAHGVAAESSYVELAGRLLGLPATNLGVCAYSPVTSALLLDDDIRTVLPRVVVYGMGNFHLERVTPRADSDLFQAWAACSDSACRIVGPAFDNRLVFSMAPAVERLYYAPRLAGAPTPFDMQRFKAIAPLAWQDVLRTLQPKSIALRFAPTRPPEERFCRFILRHMYETCSAHKAIFVLLWFPKEFGDRPVNGIQAAAQELSQHPGFIYVDCSPGLFTGIKDQAGYSSRWQVPRDGHPNRLMHAEMARALTAALAPMLASSPDTASLGR